MSRKRPSILFLPGVFLRDCNVPEESAGSEEVVEVDLDASSEEINLDDIATDINDLQLMQSKTSSYKEPKEYDALPMQYIDEEHWPQKINLLCWACGLSIDGRPEPAAIIGCSKKLVASDLTEQSAVSDADLLRAANPLQEVVVWDIRGVSCCSACSVKYTLHSSDPKIVDREESIRLYLMYRKCVTGEEISHIPIANDRTTLKKYCGPIGKSVAKFKEENANKVKEFALAVKKSTVASFKI